MVTHKRKRTQHSRENDIIDLISSDDASDDDDYHESTSSGSGDKRVRSSSNLSKKRLRRTPRGNKQQQQSSSSSSSSSLQFDVETDDDENGSENGSDRNFRKLNRNTTFPTRNHHQQKRTSVSEESSSSSSSDNDDDDDTYEPPRIQMASKLTTTPNHHSIPINNNNNNNSTNRPTINHSINTNNNQSTTTTTFTQNHMVNGNHNSTNNHDNSNNSNRKVANLNVQRRFTFVPPPSLSSSPSSASSSPTTTTTTTTNNNTYKSSVSSVSQKSMSPVNNMPNNHHHQINISSSSTTTIPSPSQKRFHPVSPPNRTNNNHNMNNVMNNGNTTTTTTNIPTNIINNNTSTHSNNNNNTQHRVSTFNNSRTKTTIQTVCEQYPDCPLYTQRHLLQPIHVFEIEKRIVNGLLKITDVDLPFIRSLESYDDHYQQFLEILNEKCELRSYVRKKNISIVSSKEARFKIKDSVPYVGQDLSSKEYILFEIHIKDNQYTLHGPNVQVFNKLIGKFGPSRLLRVSLPKHSVDEEADAAILAKRFRVAGMEYEFLSCSGSGLRERQYYCISLTGTNYTIADVFNYMGDFSGIKTVSKLMTRTSLYFSTAIPTIEIPVSQVDFIDDITTKDESYMFTDGCGYIGEELFTRILEEINVPPERMPFVSAIQIRYLGAKGVLVVNRRYAKDRVAIPKSMNKFPVHNPTKEQLVLGVLDFAQSRPVKLNRDLILIAQDRGVPFSAFESLADIELEKVKQVKADPLDHFKSSSKSSQVFKLVKRLLAAGFETTEPYIRYKINEYLESQFQKLLNKFKISIPKSGYLMGVADWGRFLKEGCVYVRINNEQPLSGDILIGRHPMTSSGDLRRVTAIPHPALNHLSNVIVFSTYGDRPITDMTSGGDLDGDHYVVIWDQSFVEPFKNAPAAKFSAEENTAPDNTIVPDESIGSKILKMKRYFLGYYTMQRTLERISTIRTIIADKQGMHSELVQEAANYVNRALDSTKTGISFRVPEYLEGQVRQIGVPHYMVIESKWTPKSSHSDSFCGKLFDIVQERSQGIDAVLGRDCEYDRDITPYQDSLTNQDKAKIQEDIENYKKAFIEMKTNDDPELNVKMKKIEEDIHKRYMAEGQYKMLAIAAHFYKYTYEENYLKRRDEKAALATAFMFPFHLMRIKADAIADKRKPGSVALTILED